MMFKNCILKEEPKEKSHMLKSEEHTGQPTSLFRDQQPKACLLQNSRQNSNCVRYSPHLAETYDSQIMFFITSAISSNSLVLLK